MTDMENRTGEHAMAVIVMRILIRRRNGCANLDQMRARIEGSGELTDEDLEPSDSLPNEPVWYQILRNINSNRRTRGNFIYEGYLLHLPGGGYCITNAGRGFLRVLDRL